MNQPDSPDSRAKSAIGFAGADSAGVNDTPTGNASQVWKFHKGETPQQQSDELAVEEPLQIAINGRPFLLTMRTPGHDGELAAGLLLAEGVIGHRSDLASIHHCEKDPNRNLLKIELASHCQLDSASSSRTSYANSACGVCGKTSIEELRNRFPRVTSDRSIDKDLLWQLPERLLKAQTHFQRTGALHAAALFKMNGDLLTLREDVGRHNAVDKVLGYALMQNWLPLDEVVLLVSGRVAFEIVHKALAGGIPIIAGVSGPTSLAVAFAEQNGQTLIGFLREHTMNLYSHPQRLNN